MEKEDERRSIIEEGVLSKGGLFKLHKRQRSCRVAESLVSAHEMSLRRWHSAQEYVKLGRRIIGYPLLEGESFL